MKIIDGLQQGSEEWIQHRLTHFNASESAAMLGLDPKFSRDDLLRLKKFGIEQEFSDYILDVVFPRGHEVEALARPIAAEIIGEDLYPQVCVDGRLSASLDGITIMDDCAWEHKQYNEYLFVQVKNGKIPNFYWPQCQQILLITKAPRILFMVSDGTRERCAHVFMEPRHDWFDRINAGWARFEKDLETYEFTRRVFPVPEITDNNFPLIPYGAPPADLVIQSKQFVPLIRQHIESLITKPESEEDWGLAVTQAKTSREHIHKLEKIATLIEADILPSTQAATAIRQAANDLKQIAIYQEKIVKERKAEIKANAITAARKQLDDAIAAANKRIAPATIESLFAYPNFVSELSHVRTPEKMEAKLTIAVKDALEAIEAIEKHLQDQPKKEPTQEEKTEDSAAFVESIKPDHNRVVQDSFTTDEDNEQNTFGHNRISCRRFVDNLTACLDAFEQNQPLGSSDNFYGWFALFSDFILQDD